MNLSAERSRWHFRHPPGPRGPCRYACVERLPANQGDTNGNVVLALRASAQDTTNQVGQEITRRNLSVQPMLTVRPGFPMDVMVNKDLPLRPYQPLFLQRGPPVRRLVPARRHGCDPDPGMKDQPVATDRNRPALLRHQDLDNGRSIRGNPVCLRRRQESHVIGDMEREAQESMRPALKRGSTALRIHQRHDHPLIRTARQPGDAAAPLLTVQRLPQRRRGCIRKSRLLFARWSA